MATKSVRSNPRPKKAAPSATRPTRTPAKSTGKRPAPKRKARPAAGAASASASKQAQLIALLQSPSGGTLAQMTLLTGWQPHSVRGVISGVLRKRLGLDVSSEVHDGSRVYRIGAAA